MHDLSRIVRDLQESLSLDKTPVALLVGAGCPLAVRVNGPTGENSPLIPDVAGLTMEIKSKLSKNKAFGVLVEQFTQDERSTYTIEDLLSHVRLLSRIVGKGEARGIKLNEIIEVEREMCKSIAETVNKSLPTKETPYHDLAKWIGGARRSKPITIFTTNYDLLLEEALEDESVPYFDGFVGSKQPFFDITAIEEDIIPLRWTRLWKIHGSINWHKVGLSGSAVIRTAPSPDFDGGVLIHPSEMKYDQSRKMPYLAMIDQLKKFLRQPSASLVTIGYSFSDEHLNDVLLHSAKSNPTCVVFGLLFKSLNDEPGIKKISGSMPTNFTILGNDSGYSRGICAPWSAESSGDRQATPTCDLGDFKEFGLFLKKLIREQRSAPSA